MPDSFAGLGCFGILIAAVVSVYPLLALGRIWLYSKQQVELLVEVRDILKLRSGA